MRQILWLTAILCFLVAMLSTVKAADWKKYPDAKLTPGATASVTKDQVCKIGYTKDARHVTQATKVLVMDRYGLNAKDLSKYEIDHFISLELGGSNDPANLWPQPYCPNKAPVGSCMGAREKDVVETCLHRIMCKQGSSIELQDVQKAIKTDWVAVYGHIKAWGCTEGLIP